MAIGELHPEDFPGLHPAFQAWRHKDYAQEIQLCLMAMGILEPVITGMPQGRCWSFNKDSAAIYIVLNKPLGEVAVESPMLKVAYTQRVAMMRTLLEMNGRLLGASRFCLRDDTVVLRFVEKGKHLSPPLLMSVIGEVAVLADQFDDVLAAAFDARMMGPVARSAKYNLAILGEPRGVPMIAKRVEAARRKRQAAPQPNSAASGAGMASQFMSAIRASLTRKGKVTGGALQPVAHAMQQRQQQTKGTNQEQLWHLCEDLRSTLDLAEVLASRGASPVSHLLSLRALLFTVHGRYATSCPDAVWFLMARGERLIQALPPEPGLFVVGNPKAEEAMESLELYQDLIKVIDKRGVSHRRFPPAELPRFASRTLAKAHLSALLDLLDRSTRSSMLHVMVLRGALYEVQARSELPQRLQAKLDGFIVETTDQAVSDALRKTLRQHVETIAYGAR